MTRPVQLSDPRPAPPQIAADTRVLIRDIADRLMPDDGLLPSVDAADTAGRHLDVALVARPDLVGRFLAAVDQCREADLDAALAGLRQADDPSWEVLTTILPAAYLMSEEVRAALGYAGQRPDPIEPGGHPEDIALTETVVARGAIYRPTPGR